MTVENLHQIPIKLRKSSAGKKRERTLTTKWFFPLLRKAGWDPETIEGRFIVHEELTGVSGRVDIALKAGKRILACIELKDSAVAIDDFAKRQAAKYAASYYYVSEGVLDPVLAICTNGIEAFIMDPALADPTAPANVHKIDLTNENGINEFSDILRPDSLDRDNGSLPVIATNRKLDPRPFASSATEAFEKTIYKMVDTLRGLKYKTNIAVEMTIQCLLLAAARDNGIIPNSVIQTCMENENWARLANHCEKLFGNVFSGINGKRARHIWHIYDATRNFNVRLDILPVQYMGTIYEHLIKKYFGNKTSFYTPEDMIDRVLDHCKPTMKDSILDPTCGSGAFLCKAVDRATRRISTPEALLPFFKGIIGVDKDPVACRIAKVSLLCTFMRKVGEEYRRTGKPLPKPQIQPDVDFFDWKGGRFSLILGNPPWESIDKLPKSRKKHLSNRKIFSVYEDKNDQLCYIVEKALKRHLSPGGRFGFVIKLQSLLGDKYSNFCKFLDNKVEVVFDYGSQQKFGNYAQSAGITGRLGAKKWIYIPLVPEVVASIADARELFRDKFNATQGAQSSADPVYYAFGADFPEHQTVRLHPTNLSFGGPAGSLVPMAYVWQDQVHLEFSRWINLESNKEHKLKLLARADVKASGRYPLSWRRDNSQQLKGPILVTERNLTPGLDRFPFLVDATREFLPLGGQTCIGSLSSNVSDLRLLGAIMMSSFFVPLCRACNLIPRRAGSIFLNPKTLTKRLQLPVLRKDDQDRLLSIISKLEREGRAADKADLSRIDSILQSYFVIGEQQREEASYSDRLLSEFLQPTSEDAQEAA